MKKIGFLMMALLAMLALLAAGCGGSIQEILMLRSLG